MVKIQPDVNTVPAGVKRKYKPRGGSRKGVPNKVTKQLKDMILGALDGVGGQKYLQLQAKKNPGPFLALVGKVLPTTLAGDPSSPMKMVIEISNFSAADEKK